MERPTKSDCGTQVNEYARLSSCEPTSLGGGEDYSRLRPLSYPQTDCFLVAFCLVGHERYPEQHVAEAVRDRLVNYWIAEIKHHCPGTPFILVGTKRDLVGDDRAPVMTFEQAEAIANETGALAYMECSAKNLTGVDQIFELATTAREVADVRAHRRKRRDNCIIQ
jgi:cell division control protein 42